MIFVIESTKYLGSDHTSEPLRRVTEFLFGYDACANWDTIHHLIRKTGHFLGYGAFSLICFRGFMMIMRNAAKSLAGRLRAHALGVFVTFLVACADEFHQSFLPNRTGTFSDVLLDTCGAVALGLALFIVTLALNWLKRSRTTPSRRQPHRQKHPALV
jgi:VanZ family protein